MKHVYVLNYEACDMPHSVDGEWSGTIAVFEKREDAKKKRDFIEANKDPNFRSWLGDFSKDQDGFMVSDRGLALAISKVELVPATLNTPSIRVPSDVKKLHVDQRNAAYVALIENGWQDSLEARISAGVDLSEDEVNAFVEDFCKRCRDSTKDQVRYALQRVPDIRSWSIYGRVLFHQDGRIVSYCAGQDYPSEVAHVRELLKKG